MNRYLPLALVGLLSASALYAEPVPVKNGTFKLGEDGSPTDWQGYPPAAAPGTSFTAGASGGVLITDNDKANGLGLGQWVNVTAGHKYKAVLKTGGSGGLIFQMSFLSKIPGKMAMIGKSHLLEKRQWVKAGEDGVLEGVAPAGSTVAWVWVYSPKAADTCALEAQSVQIEDLGSDGSVPAPAAGSGAPAAPVPAATPLVKRPDTETLPAGTIKVIDFETGDLTQPRMLEGGKKDVVTAPDPVRGGKYALKISMTHDQHRSEVVSYRSAPSGNYKYGWSVYVPETFDGATFFSIVTQWHTWGSGKAYAAARPGPPTCLTISKNAWQFKLQYQDGETAKAAEKYFDLGPIQPDRGKWTDFVLDVNWQSPKKGGGFLRLYKNGVKVIDYDDPTWFEEKTDGPFFKMGIYKGGASWTGEESGAILYFDEFRMGGPGTPLDAVDPAKQAGPRKP
ncbi:MAG: polysaccharide lyase [Chthoniobacteraceae bacterium]